MTAARAAVEGSSPPAALSTAVRVVLASLARGRPALLRRGVVVVRLGGSRARHPRASARAAGRVGARRQRVDCHRRRARTQREAEQHAEDRHAAEVACDATRAVVAAAEQAEPRERRELPRRQLDRPRAQCDAALVGRRAAAQPRDRVGAAERRLARRGFCVARAGREREREVRQRAAVRAAAALRASGRAVAEQRARNVGERERRLLCRRVAARDREQVRDRRRPRERRERRRERGVAEQLGKEQRRARAPLAGKGGTGLPGRSTSSACAMRTPASSTVSALALTSASSAAT